MLQRPIALWNQDEAGHRGGWSTVAFNEVASRLSDKNFPCVFSRNAFRKNIVVFAFVDDYQKDSIELLAESFDAYVKLSQDWDGSIDTASPMVVAFSQRAVRYDGEDGSIDQYEAFGWRVLEDVSSLDRTPWPSHVPRSPSDPGWTMCFAGMELFCNMSTPAHVNRRSRNLGNHFFMVINPRARFDIFAGDTPAGRNVRRNIRERVDKFDDISHSLDLASYNGTSHEWKQYCLRDDNASRTDRCPFEVPARANSMTNQTKIERRSADD